MWTTGHFIHVPYRGYQHVISRLATMLFCANRFLYKGKDSLSTEIAALSNNNE